MSKNKRIIWTNNDYEEWKKCMLADGEAEEDLDIERYYDDCSLFLDDERMNLKGDAGGVIVAFGDLGLWNGRHKGSKVVGREVSDILYANADYITWYCDRYNVRCDATHHDGTNHYLYRVAPDEETAKEIAHAIAYEDMSERAFTARTKSLREFVAKVYGW